MTEVGVLTQWQEMIVLMSSPGRASSCRTATDKWRSALGRPLGRCMWLVVTSVVGPAWLYQVVLLLSDWGGGGGRAVSGSRERPEPEVLGTGLAETRASPWSAPQDSALSHNTEKYLQSNSHQVHTCRPTYRSRREYQDNLSRLCPLVTVHF